MKAKHIAMISSVITFASCIMIGKIWSEVRDPTPEKIGSFEFEGTKIDVIKSGSCSIFITKWKDQPEPRFFFNCDGNKW